MRIKRIYKNKKVIKTICVTSLFICLLYGISARKAPRKQIWRLRDVAGRSTIITKDLQLYEAEKKVGNDDSNLRDTPGMTSGKVLWIILSRRQSWSLDMTLQSLKGFRKVLVSFESSLRDSHSFAEKYGVVTLSYPYDCHRNDRTMRGGLGGDFYGDECHKNHWWWAVEIGWGHNPDTLCVTEDDVILHPDTKQWLAKHPSGTGAGIRMVSSGETAAPWCFGREIWRELKTLSDIFCTTGYSDWTSTIGSLISNGYITNNIIYAPSVDLGRRMIDCIEPHSAAYNCSNINSRAIQAWLTTKVYSNEKVKTTWPDPREKSTKRQKTLIDHSRCKGLCKGFQFTPGNDKHVFVNNLRSGVKAYMIDLGPVCIDASKVHVSKGGESIKDVIGRDEALEFPRYDYGAWQIHGNMSQLPTMNYQNGVTRSAIVVEKIPQIDVKGTTIAFQRNEYANLCFNTMYLFNLHLTLNHVPAENVLWLDGHAVGNLDEMWSKIFGLNIHRLGHLSGTTCFERVVLMPLKSPIFRIDKFGDCNVDEFVHRILDAYNVTLSEDKHDTVIVRSYYLAHPRQGPNVERGFTTEQLEKLRQKLPGAKFVRFHELTLSQQLQTIANTKTLYGIHGAGCTMGLFLSPGSQLVEWVVPSRSGTFTFANLMTWRPDVRYQRIGFDEWLEGGVVEQVTQ